MVSEGFHHAEGIILKVVPFRDYDQILTLFTPYEGVIKLFYHGSRSKRRGGQGACIPLTKVEIVYQESRGEMFTCRELRLVESYPFLRDEWLHLETGCDLIHTISVSQLAGKGAPLLYLLLCLYLQKIPHLDDPWVLPISFRLKLLKHDGLVAFPFICTECGELLLTGAYTLESECWCALHQEKGARFWEQCDLELLYRLTNCQSYREICSDQISKAFQSKVIDFFNENIN
jgi:DNA repair protein RecO (recombination protein O)